MGLIETTAKSLLRKQKQIDSWFCCAYGMNIYRGCAHNCTYCDGRSETYQVEGDFGSDISVKVNAPELLEKELDPARKRKPMKRAYIFIGGGVNDAYQPVEEKYGLTRRVLEIILEYGQPVHILTKSVLVQRDIDLLVRISRSAGAVVSFSFSTIDDRIAAVFEPGVPPPSRRIAAIRRLKDAGLSCGMYLLPILPFITDRPEQIDAVFEAAQNARADFLVFGGLTLKEGRQKEYYMQALRRYARRLGDEGDTDGLSLQYDILYPGDPYGNPIPDYYLMLNELVFDIARNHRIPLRMPPNLFRGILDENDRIAVMLDHLDYFQRARGLKSTFGWAARKVRELELPVSELGKKIRSVNGIGPETYAVIDEIRATGTSSKYEKYLYGGR